LPRRDPEGTHAVRAAQFRPRDHALRLPTCGEGNAGVRGREADILRAGSASWAERLAPRFDRRNDSSCGTARDRTGHSAPVSGGTARDRTGHSARISAGTARDRAGHPAPSFEPAQWLAIEALVAGSTASAAAQAARVGRGTLDRSQVVGITPWMAGAESRAPNVGVARRSGWGGSEPACAMPTSRALGFSACLVSRPARSCARTFGYSLSSSFAGFESVDLTFRNWNISHLIADRYRPEG
jgi:hypothetical protein